MTVPGIYEIVVTSIASGCTDTASTVVIQTDGIENILFTANSPTCFGGADGLLEIDSVVGFNPPFTYVLENGNATQTPVFTGLASGFYNLTVIDLAGCETTLDFTLTDPPLLEVELGNDVEISLGEIVQLSATVSVPVNAYIWTNTASLSCVDCPDPIAQPATTTLYSLTVSTGSGCTASDDILVAVNDDVGIYHPNAFSPNNDGFNDVFTLFAGDQVTTISRLMVFGRWGQKIYEGSNFPLNDVKFGWDGTYKGQLMDAGVYVFYAEIILANGGVVKQEGEVLLVR